LNSIKQKNNILPILLSLIPISLLVGNSAINLLIVIIDLYFIFELKQQRKLKLLNNKLFYNLIFIWFLLLLNSIFIAENLDSFIRSFGFIRFIILIFSINYLLRYHKISFNKIILPIWAITFFIVTIDILVEFSFGRNILGYRSDYNGRIASFTNDELIIGNYYFGFALIVGIFLKNKYLENNLFLINILLISFVIISFIIGERSNFIKIFFIISIFMFLVNGKKILLNLLSLSTIFLIAFLILKGDNFYESRFISEIYKPIKESSFKQIYINSRYHDHHSLAYEIFKKNKIFGVGIKNFRNISINEIDNKKLYKMGINTHPHQIHYEFLSETGLFGYLIFIIFFIYSIGLGIKKYSINKNPYVLSSTLFISATFLPILPSGSFFTTFSATIFWINYAFLFTEN